MIRQILLASSWVLEEISISLPLMMSNTKLDEVRVYQMIETLLCTYWEIYSILHLDNFIYLFLSL